MTDDNRELKNILTWSKNEIENLRRQKEISDARLEMFDSMMLLFTSQPNSNRQGMTEDIVSKIDDYLWVNRQEKFKE